MARSSNPSVGGRASRSRRRGDGEERLILGVPARFMKPRLIFIAAIFALVGFGLLMIYSSSSITSLISKDYGNDPAYYVERQLMFVAFGTAFAFALFKCDYHLLSGRLMPVIWVVMVLALGLIFLPFAGADAYGASRWIAIGPIHLQPSEFAKVAIVVIAAGLLSDYMEKQRLDTKELLKRAALLVGVPLMMILLQPDKGTMMICAVTILVMLWFAGVPRRWVVGLFAVGIVGMVALSLRDSYSRARIMTVLNPWSDPYGSGYQLIQGFYAFGSGGLFGVGIGMGRQKYSYLPMAYNDFIYAVIGEECGLVGTLGVLAGFGIMLWAGLKIARYAPDMTGQLIATGSVTMLVVQLLLNVSGVVGVFPLSGKPVPFISYGGSSVMSCLMLAGLVLSVSKQSRLPVTEHDRVRMDWSVTQAPRVDQEGVSEPMPRSARGSTEGLGGGSRFRVIGGGASPTPLAGSRTPLSLRAERDLASRHPEGRVSVDSNGRRRIDLGPSAGERLRKRDEGPDVRGRRPGGGRNGERRGR